MGYCANSGADDSGICMRVKQLRQDREEKQETVAKALGVARTTYSKLESGANKFSVDMIIRLANYFSVDCDYLLRGYTSSYREICNETGLSGKAVENLKIYGPMQKTLTSLLESVPFSSFLAWIHRYTAEANKQNPLSDASGSAELQAYREALEKEGFVVTTHAEAARNCYETALEELKKALDEIVKQNGGAQNGQHS